MKQFSALFAVIIVLCISGLAQKKSSFDPCQSRDPKVRATSKKPCPSTPRKTITPPTKPNDSDSPNDEDGNSPNSPSKKSPKNTYDDGTMFFITIESGGKKTEIKYTQFDNHSGQAVRENEQSGRMLINYGASNNTVGNDASFSFQGMIATPAKGVYPLSMDGVTFSLQTTEFPNYQILSCDSGSYEITAMPLPGGFVEGTFNCSGETYSDRGDEKMKYSMSGSFKLERR